MEPHPARNVRYHLWQLPRRRLSEECRVAGHAAELGIDPARIVIAGNSAGGGLAAATTLMARDNGGPALIGQLLSAPMLDDRDATLSTRQFDGPGPWNRGDNRFGWTALD